MLTKWDHRFLDLAWVISTWSKDPRTKVGAVITSDRQIISTGYNGFPKGLSDDLNFYLDVDYKLAHVIHAEHNAILNAVVPVKGATLYSTFAPCQGCTNVIIQSGISRVVCPMPPESRWLAQQTKAKFLMRSVNIEVIWNESH